MNELTPMNFNGIDVVDSRQVAEAIGKNHANMMREIRTYCGYLNEIKIDLVDFFIESTYIDNKGEKRACYLCTRKGCEMIANKLTGKKGVVFTVLYINAFHKMEKQCKQQENYSGIDMTDIVMAIKELYEKNCELNYKIEKLNTEINRLNHNQNIKNLEFTVIIRILCERLFKKQSRKSKAREEY